MNQASKNIVKRFGRIQAFIAGVALGNNFVCFALISLIPAFGKNGVVISAALMLFLSGLIEIPTGRYADRVGWVSSIRIGLFGKLLSTVAMIAAIYFALSENTSLMWACIALEAVIDGIGCAFLSGALQVHYNHQYLEASESKDPPSLFLESYPYGLWIRFAIPCIAAFIGYATVNYWSASDEGLHILATLPLVFILLMRIAVFYLAYTDTKKKPQKIPEKKPGYKTDVRDSFLFCLLAPSTLASYCFFQACRLTATMVALGEAYKMLIGMGYSYSLSWLGGMSISIFIFFIHSMVAALFYPKMAKKVQPEAILRWSFLSCIGGSLCLLIALKQFPNSGFTPLITYGFCLITLFFTGLATNQILPQIQKIAPKGQEASWISVGEFFTLTIFSCILFVSTQINLSYSGLSILCLAQLILGFVLTLRTKHLNTAPRKELKLKKILLMLIGSTLIIFATCGGLAFLHFEVNAKLKQLDNLRRADLTSSSESASVALLQGSFTEAIRRANETVGANGLGCVEVEYNGEKLNSCVDASDRFIVNVLYMPGNKSVVLGTLTGHYASQDTYQELWSLLLKILLWTLIVAFGLFFTFASLIKFLQNEWEVASGKVFGLHQSSTGLREKSSYISEVNQAANSFLQAKKSVVELEAAETIIENAAQVAHDIRSPLCALEAISLSANGLQDKQQRIFKQALSRMRSVCDELSFKKLNSLRPQKEPGSDLKRREKDNEVKENLKKLFEEKSIQAFDSKSITQDISIDIPDGVFLQGLEVTTLIRVLSNLFDNAIEAIETEGGVRFSANLTNNNTWISFHISDNGRGLPPDQLELVGSKGFTFGKTEGNGLGLFNAKQSVESAGGVFVFDSWLGKGSVVEIRLPISE